MKLKKHSIQLDVDSDKELYDWRLLNCTTYMSHLNARRETRVRVFIEYYEFYDLKPTAELRAKFDRFWRGSTRNEDMLQDYERLIESIKSEEL